MRRDPIVIAAAFACASGLRAEVPAELESRIRDAYRAGGELRFEVREFTLPEPEDRARVIRVTFRSGVALRTDDNSPYLQQTMQGMNGVIDREDGVYSIVRPTMLGSSERPAQLYLRKPGLIPHASVRVAPFRRGEWILAQFRGDQTRVEDSGGRLTLRRADGAAKVVLDSSDLSFLSARLTSFPKMTIESRGFHSRSPMKAKWPLQIDEAVGPVNPDQAGPQITTLKYSPAESAKLPADEFDWWKYTPTGVDQANGRVLGPNNLPTGETTSLATRVVPVKRETLPTPTNSDASGPASGDRALPPPPQPGVPWLWAVGITCLIASALLFVRRRFAA